MGKKKTLKERTKKIQLTVRGKGGYTDKSGKVYSEKQGTTLLMSGKAKLVQWHGRKTLTESYEGGQYYGGRKKGSKTLKKLDNGNVMNQHGVEFSQADKKKLESLANRANRKRMQLLEAEAKLPRKKDGKPTGQTVGQLQAMGKESDFILSRKSKSLQRFRSREDFEYYIANLERVNSPEYLEERTRLYKKNHMTALKNVFGDEAKDVIMKIRMMKPEKYRELLQQEEDLEVSYIYDPSARTGKLNKIRRALNMKEKEYIEDV